jgi:hypothetical protein
LFSFAGFSLSGLGDINQDGFDDIIIGSIPYYGRYLTQKSYVIYGNNSTKTLALSQMTEEVGFSITGGGFMVAGPGDVNGDGIPDIMVSSYQQWQGKGNSYIMVYPRNITSPPTFLPSSQPSTSPSVFPSSLPSFRVHDPSSTPTFQETTNEPVSEGTFPPFLEATEKPSFAPKTSKPTRIPSFKPSTRSPTIKTNIPSAVPTRKPTILPTTEATSRPPTKSPVSSAFPTSFPSVTPTESVSTPFQEIIIDSAGAYNLPGGKANCLISGVGDFIITSNGGGKKVYTILPSKNVITVTDFNKRNDQISVIHFPYLYSINDLLYRTNPLQFFLSAEQKLVLLSMDTTDLTEENFMFQKSDDGNGNKINFHLDLPSIITLGTLLGFVGLCIFAVKINEKNEGNTNYSKELYQDKSPQMNMNIKPENDEELNEELSSDSGSFVLSSSDSEGEDEDEFTLTISSVENMEEERELYENDWNLLSSWKSLFSSENNSVETLEEKLESVADVYNVVDPPEEEEEQSFVFTESDDQQETSDGRIDIEGNYRDNDEDDMDSFSNSHTESH